MQSSIKELSQDLVTRLLTVPALAANNGVSVSFVDDPKSTQYQNIPIPFAGVRLVAETNINDNPNVKCVQPIRTIFSISLHVQNGSETILNDTSFPFLDEVREAIQNKYASSAAYAWQFDSARTLYVDETRIHYIQYYSVITPK